jgi:hypothetical protein
MTESERESLRRRYDESMHEFASRNADSISELSKEMRQLHVEFQKVTQRFSDLEGNQRTIALQAAREATKETLVQFGLPSDQKGIEEVGAILRFGKGAYSTVKTIWTVGFTLAITIIVGAIFRKMGWV